MILFTKSGYLMFTKSLQDDKAWEVMRVLVDSYFQHEEIKQVLKETGGVYVAPEAADDDHALLFAKALKAADLMLAKRDASQPAPRTRHRCLVAPKRQATDALQPLPTASLRALPDKDSGSVALYAIHRTSTGGPVQNFV